MQRIIAGLVFMIFLIQLFSACTQDQPAPTILPTLPPGTAPAPSPTATISPTATPSIMPVAAMPKGVIDDFEASSAAWKAALPPTYADSSALKVNLTNAHATSGQGALRLGFEKNNLPKAIFILEKPFDFSKVRYLEFSLFNPDTANGVVVALSTGSAWEWHESQTVPLKYDQQTVTFDLRSNDWKTAASNWEYNSAVKELGQVQRLAIILFPNQAGSVYIDDIRLSDTPHGTLPATAEAATSTPLPQIAFTNLTLKLLAAEAKVYTHFQLSIDTDGSVANPFDPAQADLKVRFTSPSGITVLTPAFWYQEFDPQTLAPTGAPGWRVRYTPNEPGAWTAQAELASPALKSAELVVNVAANPTAHGFLRINAQDPRYFALDDGTFFFPVGLNIAWSTGDVLKDYTTWLDRFSQNGGNFIRVWMAAWAFGIEWKDTGLGNYSARLRQAWLLDQVLKLAEDRGIYVMLCFVNHGAFSETTNPEWASNPFNAALGGPLTAPGDFVTNPTARDLFKRRLRYTAARWAAYPSLGVWEWWNEINWTPISDNALKPWITEMTEELQKYDPYNHLLSTSYSGGANNSIWAMPELSFAQQHDYSASDPTNTLPLNRVAIQKKAGDKPAVLAEYGSSTESEDTPYNKGGIHLHNGLWAAPFSGYAGTAMYWWWDNYIDPYNLWFQNQGISAFLKGENLAQMVPSKTITAPRGATALILSSPELALVWVRDDTYQIKDAQAAYEKELKEGVVPGPEWSYSPPALENLAFSLQGLQDGLYRITWYSTLDGQPIGDALDITSQGGSVTINLPRFQFDLALKVVKAP